MSEFERDALPDLLRQASPRPAPSAADIAMAKAAVRDEWRDVTGRRRRRQRWAQAALAATVLVTVFTAFNTLRAPAGEPVRVAMIEKSFGPVYLLGEQAELRETGDLSNVLSGQTIVTGSGAGLALAWGGGGSLRIDEASRIRFADDGSVFLESGRLYFDSQPAPLGVTGHDGTSARFLLRTAQGVVSHVGTQFMTRVDGEVLVVSVREGTVRIDGRWHRHTASRGEQVALVGSQRPSILNLDTAGAAWDWVGRTTPSADVDGRTLHEFLVWVCREMGLELQFVGQAEDLAHAAILKGTIDSAPAEALRLRLETADLRWRIEEGVIYIID